MNPAPHTPGANRPLPFGRLLAVVLAVLVAACGSDGEAPAADDPAPVTDAGAAARPPADEPDTLSVAQHVANQVLETRVRLALAETDNLPYADIHPQALMGRVTLHGTVRTGEQRQRAAAVAGRVDGVRQVVNALDAADAPSEPTQAGAPEQMEPAPPQPVTGDQAGQDDAADGDSADGSAEQYYTVRSGDSLWKIARANDLSVQRLKQLNNLRSNNVRPGQRLRVR